MEESCYEKNFYGTFGVEMRAYGQKLVRNWSHFAHTQVTVSVFKTSRHSKLLIFVKNKGQWNAKSGPKVGMGKLLCEKIYGTFGVEMRAYGQKLVKFCKHTDASKLVVEIWEIRGKLTTKTWNSMKMKIDRCQKHPILLSDEQQLISFK